MQNYKKLIENTIIYTIERFFNLINNVHLQR
jgi:hypothetical protein